MVTFMEYNDRFWHRIEEGIMTREELHQVRWASILKALDIPGDSARMERVFREQLRDSAVAIPGAREMLAYLSGRVPVWAASNANRDQQEHRLEKAGMLKYIQGVLASGNIGANKPEKAFFEACLARVAPIKPQECLMIGDSIKADMIGAAQTGMLTCWYHPSGKGEEPRGMEPDWMITDLREIRDIMEASGRGDMEK